MLVTAVLVRCVVLRYLRVFRCVCNDSQLRDGAQVFGSQPCGFQVYGGHVSDSNVCRSV